MHDAKMSQTEMNSTRKITLGSGDKSLVVTIISHVVHGFALSTGSAANGTRATWPVSRGQRGGS